LIKDLEIEDIDRGAINLVDLANIISFVYIAWMPKNNPIRMISDRANDDILESEDKILLNECVERMFEKIKPCLIRAVVVAQAIAK